MSARRPVADSYAEAVDGPARDATDPWERRRWWSRALRAAGAFVVGLLVVQLLTRSGLPGSTMLNSTPAFLIDPLALVLGAGLFWLGRNHQPLRGASSWIDAVIDRTVR